MYQVNIQTCVLLSLCYYPVNPPFLKGILYLLRWSLRMDRSSQQREKTSTLWTRNFPRGSSLVWWAPYPSLSINSIFKIFWVLICECMWFSPRPRTCASMRCLERRRFRKARGREWLTPDTEGTTSSLSSIEPSWSSDLHPKPPAPIQQTLAYPVYVNSVQIAGVRSLNGFDHFL